MNIKSTIPTINYPPNPKFLKHNLPHHQRMLLFIGNYEHFSFDKISLFFDKKTQLK